MVMYNIYNQNRWNFVLSYYGKLWKIINTLLITMDIHVLQIPKSMVSIGNSGTYINYGKKTTLYQK